MLGRRRVERIAHPWRLVDVAIGFGRIDSGEGPLTLRFGVNIVDSSIRSTAVAMIIAG